MQVSDNPNIFNHKWEDVDAFVSRIASKPENFALPSKDISNQALRMTKLLFDQAKNDEEHSIGRMGNLTELIVDGFDSEQIWQELDLQNETLFQYLSDLTENLLEEEEDLNLYKDFNASDQEDSDIIDEDEEESEVDDFDSNLQTEGLNEDQSSVHSNSGSQSQDQDDSVLSKGEKPKKKKEGLKKKKKSNDEDEFFDMDEMMKFADEGQSGGGLLIGTGDSDEEDIYSMMYGNEDEDDQDGEDFQSKRGKSRAIANNSRNRKAMEDHYDEEEDDEDNEDGDDDDDNDEDIYFEDFFGEVKPTRGDSSDSLEEFNQVDQEEEEGEDSIQGSMSGDMEERSEDDDAAPGLSSFQREQRRRDREISKMQSEMMDEDTRDEKTMVSTGDLGVSAFEAHQRHLQRKTERLEDELVGKKKWATTGEVKASQRGVNSLLEEDLDFDLATKQAPIITGNYTKNIEEMIKRRILDKVFDDMIRKVDKPDRGDYRARSADIIDQEKSKKSLSQIYEDDYMQQTHQAGPENTTVSEQHQEAARLFQSVCKRLDALANAHFTPYKVKDEVEVIPIKDAAAIRMEEVAPITTSDAALLAPEEVYRSESKGVTRGASEWTHDEKQQNRRDKKRQYAKHQAEKESERKRDLALHPEKAKRKPSITEALKQIQKGPNTTISSNKDKTHYTSSSAFQKINEAQNGSTVVRNK